MINKNDLTLKDITSGYIKNKYDIDKERGTIEFEVLLDTIDYCDKNISLEKFIENIKESLKKKLNDLIKIYYKTSKLEGGLYVRYGAREGYSWGGHCDCSWNGLGIYQKLVRPEINKEVIDRLVIKERKPIKRKLNKIAVGKEKEKDRKSKIKEFRKLKKELGI